MEYSTEKESALIDLCNVESGLQYLGIRGAESEGGCMHYTLTAIAFDTDCVELMHSPSNDPAAIADHTLPVGHWLGVGLGLGLGLGFGFGFGFGLGVVVGFGLG